LVLAVLALASSARAAEPEKVVVRNRLYSPEGSIELGVDVSTAVISRLIDHQNFQAAFAYNFTNEWAIEAMAGYAYSHHTSIADQVTSEVASKSPTTTPTVDDFPDLWEIKWNVVAGARWAPIYGKLSLSAELPVHFQAYLAAGGGAAGLQRTSVTYCLSASSVDDAGNSTCTQPLVENRVSPVVQFGGGLRFFIGPHAALRLEARDYTFPDRYQTNIQRAAAEAGDPNQGTYVSNPGFEHVVFLTAGVTYIF
jgi:outer membrane beta-barrel protein